jgi:hypothetical protein
VAKVAPRARPGREVEVVGPVKEARQESAGRGVPAALAVKPGSVVQPAAPAVPQA